MATTLNQSVSQFNDGTFQCAARPSTVHSKSLPFRSLKKALSHPKLPSYPKRRGSIRNWFNAPSRRSGPTLKSRSSAKSATSDSVIPSNVRVTKSKWRPSLEYIYDDKQLLSALLAFTRRQYSEENILFLRAVQQLNRRIDDLLSAIHCTKLQEINFEIIHIYNQYIVADAAQQVNLSYNCFNTILSARDKMEAMDLLQKQSLFDVCVAEIEKLVKLSILGDFYSSNEFQMVAASRPVSPAVILRKSSESYSLSSSVLTFPSVPASDDGSEYSLAVREPVENENALQYMMDCKGVKDGCHEWNIAIVKCGASCRYEVGVVSVMDAGVKMNELGIGATPDLGARVVYGCDTTNNSFYYASYNTDNTERCKKDLSLLGIHGNGWKAGDVVTMRLNVTKAKIKFYLNHKQVRKTISIGKTENIKYYPVVYMH